MSVLCTSDYEAPIRVVIAIGQVVVIARERRVGLENAVAVKPRLICARVVAVGGREPGGIAADGQLFRVDVAVEGEAQCGEGDRKAIVELSVREDAHSLSGARAYVVDVLLRGDELVERGNAVAGDEAVVGRSVQARAAGSESVCGRETTRKLTHQGPRCAPGGGGW
jgi:hypothetical protein